MSKQIPVEEGYFKLPDDENSRPQLLGSYSQAADKWYYPRMLQCPITETSVEDVLLPSEGILYSWSFINMPSMGSREAAAQGFGVGQVDLGKGCRVQGMIKGAVGDWKIGMKMALEVNVVGKTKDGDQLCSYIFAPAQG